jgi:hypothetical protein
MGKDILKCFGNKVLFYFHFYSIATEEMQELPRILGEAN